MDSLDSSIDNKLNNYEEEEIFPGKVKLNFNQNIYVKS